jgi:hypothetical protein
MAHRHCTSQSLQALAGENLRDQSHPFVRPKLGAIETNNARALLAAMLQGIKTIVGEFSRIRMVKNTENAAVMLGIIHHVLFFPQTNHKRGPKNGARTITMSQRIFKFIDFREFTQLTIPKIVKARGSSAKTNPKADAATGSMKTKIAPAIASTTIKNAIITKGSAIISKPRQSV